MKKMLRLVFALYALMPLASLDAAEKNAPNHRSVQGVVTDNEDTPLDGAVVQLKDTKSLQIRSFITKTNGTYHFNSLSPDVDYELKAEFKGTAGNPKTLSSFDGRKSAVINLKVGK